MIVLYSTNETVVNGVHAACETAGMEFQPGVDFSAEELSTLKHRMRVLVIDLTCAMLSTDKVLDVMEKLDSASIPPVLYLLSSPRDLEHITDSGSIVNLDYSFLPVDSAQLAARLEVLHTLGQRRRRSLETAISDRLTGLYNRKYFMRRLDEEMYRTTRYKHAVGVLLTDIDFEIPKGQLNESTSINLLPQIATFFKERLRRTDIVARYKWSQIGMVLPEICAADCEALASDIHQKLEVGHWNSEGHRVLVHPIVSWLMFPVEKLGSSIEVMSALEDCILFGHGNRLSVISYEAQLSSLAKSS
jgi:diguanylate cyclase (GGDEF)-like protein